MSITIAETSSRVYSSDVDDAERAHRHTSAVSYHSCCTVKGESVFDAVVEDKLQSNRHALDKGEPDAIWRCARVRNSARNFVGALTQEVPLSTIHLPVFIHPPLVDMAGVDAKKSKKRKAEVREEEPAPQAVFAQNVGLEMQSEDEGEDGAESDDGEVDEFPEIDTRSDSEEEGEGSEGDDEDEDEDEEDEPDVSDEDESEDASDDDFHIFPRPKTIISDITGQPKRVYPPIEPDYDSDSSTEDVRFSTRDFRMWR